MTSREIFNRSTILCCYLSSSGPVAHKVEVYPLQLALSAATRLASFQLFHPSMSLSFSIVDRHVVFGRPTLLLPSGVRVNAVSHLLFLSIRRICPTHFNLLNLTSVLIVFNFVFAIIYRFDTIICCTLKQSCIYATVLIQKSRHISFIVGHCGNSWNMK